MRDTEAEPSWQGMGARWLAFSWDRLRIIQGHCEIFSEEEDGWEMINCRIRNDMKERCYAIILKCVYQSKCVE